MNMMRWQSDVVFVLWYDSTYKGTRSPKKNNKRANEQATVIRQRKKKMRRWSHESRTR